MQALWVGLDEILCLDSLSAERDEKIPMIALSWDSKISDTQILARSIARSLALVAEAYPKYAEYREIKE
jgi:hypothetical protein